ncbi:hypothetical protein LTR82_017680 [Friedmanniomyces endolithicus]|uniref:DUF7924 domain-containing protein n=1 Tax=Friedmanniomyces endolithicus TaxID=329885 RepID=A0AAN6F626_9PEZI|nr:hypothetical protein LTR82_017680 [Friedmanniomyces endolithicus]
MTSDIHCPRAQRPKKRTFIDYAANNDHQLSSSAHFNTRTPPSKRRRLRTPVSKHRPHTPRSTTVPPSPHIRAAEHPSQSFVEAWAASISSDVCAVSQALPSRPYSCPASLDIAATLSEMSQSQSQYSQRGAATSTTAQSSSSGVKDQHYRTFLTQNGIEIDLLGDGIPGEIKTVLDQKVFKERSSPPLSDEAVDEVQQFVVHNAGATEATVTDLTSTPMFPFKGRGVKQLKNSQWNRVALPKNPECGNELVTPRPDVHHGYSMQKPDTPWTRAQITTIEHPYARLYTQPGNGVSFPFLVVEVKGEAMGGTLFHAENQAAGSGAQAVAILRWLLGQQPRRIQHESCADPIAFSISMSHREAVFHVHWWSEDLRCYFMSHLRNYHTTSPTDIRACNSAVKNIIDYALNDRISRIRLLLDALDPPPEHWTFKRPAQADPTPPPSSSGEPKRRRTSAPESQECY